jgi:dTDP-glucose 4,6-dehydratase
MFEPQKILITGGAGFIGCCYVRQMLKAYPGVTIVNLDALTYAGSTDNFEDVKDDARYTFVQGDITDGALIARLLREHTIDTLVHFAAESHVDRSISGPGAFVMTNVVGTYELLEASRLYVAEKALDENSFRFHHISTDEVFGTLSNTDPAFCETTPYAPNSPYSASKAGSDHLARAYFHTFGLPVTMSNCSNNYGPYQHDEKLIPTVIRKALAGEPIPIYGDGSNIRDWLYVYDHCSAIDLIVRKGQLGESYNVGGDAEHANIDLAKAICTKLDELAPRATSYVDQLEFVQDRAGHDWRYAINHDKLTAELGWTVHSTVETGLAETIAFYMAKYQ